MKLKINSGNWANIQFPNEDDMFKFLNMMDCPLTVQCDLFVYNKTVEWNINNQHCPTTIYMSPDN